MEKLLSRQQCGAIASVLRNQLADMMTVSHELGDLVSMSKQGRRYIGILNQRLCEQLRMARHLELIYRLTDPDEIRLVQRPIDLVEVCRDLMAQVSSVCQVLDIQISFRCNLKELLFCGDRERLEDMLLYLISNSIEAAHGQTKIMLTLQKQQDRAVLLLDDNSGGLSSEALAAFFDENIPFNSSQFPKVGLGLLLARKIAALHGGLLVADNYDSNGLRVAITLPCDLPESISQLKSRPLIPEEHYNKSIVELSRSLPSDQFLPEEMKEWI